MPSGWSQVCWFTNPGMDSRSKRETRTFLLVEAAREMLLPPFSPRRAVSGGAATVLLQTISRLLYHWPMHHAAGLRARGKAFLSFCRVEKRLAGNTISAYSADLERFIAWAGDAAE